MLDTLEIIQPDSASTTFRLSDPPLYRVHIDGVGIPNIQRRTQAFANDHGALDYGFRLDQREITLRLFYKTDTIYEEVAVRDLIYSVFMPFIYPLKLRLTRHDGSVRQIECHAVGVTDLPESERLGSSLAFNVRLVAPNPIWYDPIQRTSAYTPAILTAGSANIAFPYSGGWEEYPTIKLYGQLVSPYVQILLVTPAGTRSYQMNLSGTTIAAGDIYTFDLRPGYKTVTDNAGANQLTKVISYGGDITEFRLWPAPLMANGQNVITFGWSARDASGKLELRYYHRYVGI